MCLESRVLLAVTLLLGVTGTCGYLNTPCPLMCKCDAAMKEVTCAGNASLPTAMQYAPEDTKILHIDGADMGGVVVLRHPPVLPNLQVLRISECVGIRDVLPNVLPSFKQLHELYLIDNRLQCIDVRLLSSHLRVIDLSSNLIESLPDDVFAGLYKLQILRLSHNRIKRLSAKVFSDLESLKEIDLSHNRLQFVHPQVFRYQPVLQVVDLRSNYLTSLQETTFSGLRKIHRVDLQDNPWDCHCGMTWLQQALTDDSSTFRDAKHVCCATPPSLHSLSLQSISPDQFNCSAPSFAVLPPADIVIVYMHSTQIHCPVSGYPAPSVYWITPHGAIVNPDNSQWLSEELAESGAERSYSGLPTYYKTSVRVLTNGSLEIHKLRSYFIGEYTCVAVNQVGNVSVKVNVTITSAVSGYLTAACIIGATTAGGLAMLAMCICMLTICIERHCLKPRSHVKVLSVTIEPSGYRRPACPWHMDDNRVSPSPDPSIFEFYVPAVCVTPADDRDADRHSEEVKENTRGTLEGVRARLRTGVGTGVDRIRSRAHNVAETSSRRLQTIRESSSQYMHTMRESGGHYMNNVRESSSRYMRNIRESSSVYASRMRTGVVLGMEQVKSHVQSVKELCGTGTMIQTVSMVSVSTDVDSQQQREVVKTISFV